MERRDDLVYDIGVHNGDDTAHYLQKGYQVVGVEADPTLIPPLQERFSKEITSGQLTLFNAALASERKTAEFWICEGYSLWNSFDRSVAARMGRKHHAIEIECWPLQDLFARFSIPKYLKMSLHGHEHVFLDSLSPDFAPAYLSLEMQPDIQVSRQVFDKVSRLGYRSFKLICQPTLKQLDVRPPSPKTRLRRVAQSIPGLYNAYEQISDQLRSRNSGAVSGSNPDAAPALSGRRGFPEGSSGPFGEDTDGDWMSVESARADWEFALSHPTEQGRPDASNWYDLHVRLAAP